MQLYFNTHLVCALQADIRPQTDGCNGLRYNLTTDIIESIFRTYPAGKQLQIRPINTKALLKKKGLCKICLALDSN